MSLLKSWKIIQKTAKKTWTLVQGCYVSPWYTHTMFLHDLQVCFGPKLSLYSPFNLITHFFELQTFFSMSVLISKKVTRDMVFCSPRTCTHPRDHQNKCFIVYACHEECWGSRIDIYMKLGTNTYRVLSAYGQSTVRVLSDQYMILYSRFDDK